MRIVQVLASIGVGGLEKHVRELSAALAENGHAVFVIAAPEFLQTLPASVQGIAVNMRLNRYHPWLLWQVFCALKRTRADIIHAQANKAVSLIAWLKPWLRVACVGTMHNMKRQVRAYQAMDQVICVSRALAKTLQDVAHTQVIYNGIRSAKTLTPIVNLTVKQKPMLCAVGRLVAAKGFDILLEAVDGLSLHLVIAGDGPQKSQLLARIAKLHPDTQVTLTGHHQDVIGLMKQSDGLVISSRKEGFSYVLNEALLNGVCVISTDVPIANEVLPATLIAPIGDAKALRHLIRQYLAHPHQWQQDMQSVFVWARTQLTLSRMVNETSAMYAQLRAK